MNRVNRILLISVLLVVLFSVTVIAVEPFGASVTIGANETAPLDAAGNAPAIAGNISQLTISGFSVTQSWQGYYGEVTGTIMLADASDNVMYNWSVAQPSGEIYASTNNSLSWGYIQCFNLTADGTYGNDLSNAGATSQFGTNYTILEEEFGINRYHMDGVNETFSLDGSHESGETLTHDLFYTNNFEFTAGECVSTHLFADSDSAEDSQFQEVLLYEPNSNSVVFMSILNPTDTPGFDGSNHDFQLMVLENGHGTDTTTTTYYFWVELE
jgi:hypothetical protein